MLRPYRVIAGNQTPAVELGHQVGDRAALEDERDSLCRRLEQGYAKIERGLAEGRDVGDWEELWIALLRVYERICDELAQELAA